MHSVHVAASLVQPQANSLAQVRNNDPVLLIKHALGVDANRAEGAQQSDVDAAVRWELSTIGPVQ